MYKIGLVEFVTVNGEQVAIALEHITAVKQHWSVGPDEKNTADIYLLSGDEFNVTNTMQEVIKKIGWLDE